MYSGTSKKSYFFFFVKYFNLLFKYRNWLENFGETIRNPRPINLILMCLFILSLTCCCCVVSCCLCCGSKRRTVVIHSVERFKQFTTKNQDDKEQLLLSNQQI